MESTLYETAQADLKIIETLRFSDADGFTRLAEHIDRCELTAQTLGYEFDRGTCLQTLGEAVEKDTVRVRMTLARDGSVEVATTPLALEDRAWVVGYSTDRVASDDPFLAIKTTQRVLYDTARANLDAGLDEVIFLNERGEVCEGTITNVFAEIDGVMYTPPLACGVLPGVLRYSLISQGGVKEQVLMPEDLADAKVFVGNSTRGLIHAHLV